MIDACSVTILKPERFSSGPVFGNLMAIYRRQALEVKLMILYFYRVFHRGQHNVHIQNLQLPHLMSGKFKGQHNLMTSNNPSKNVAISQYNIRSSFTKLLAC